MIVPALSNSWKTNNKMMNKYGRQIDPSEREKVSGLKTHDSRGFPLRPFDHAGVKDSDPNKEKWEEEIEYAEALPVEHDLELSSNIERDDPARFADLKSSSSERKTSHKFRPKAVLKDDVYYKTIPSSTSKSPPKHNCDKATGHISTQISLSREKELLSKIAKLKNEVEFHKVQNADLINRFKIVAEKLKRRQQKKAENVASAPLLLSDEIVLKEKIASLEKTIASLQQRIVHEEKLTIGTSGSSTEIEQLRKDNRILLEKLKSTKEHRNFALSFDHLGQLTYLKNLNFFEVAGQSKQTDHFVAPQAGKKQREQTCLGTDKESVCWAPKKAFELLHSCRRELSTADDSFIDELLYKLNQIYRERETHLMSKAHLFCKSCSKRGECGLTTSKELCSDSKQLSELQSENDFLKTKLRSQSTIFARSFRKIEKKHKDDLRNDLLKNTITSKTIHNYEVRNRFLENINKKFAALLNNNLLFQGLGESSIKGLLTSSKI